MTTTNIDDPKASATVLVGIVGTILVFAIIVALQALYYHVEETEAYRKGSGQFSNTQTQLRAQQEADLQSYGWIDRDKGIVRVPIDVAMDLVVRESQTATSQPAMETSVWPTHQQFK